MGKYLHFLFYDPPQSNFILMPYGPPLGTPYLVRTTHMLTAVDRPTMDVERRFIPHLIQLI